jgi:hypothetical protein
VGEAAREDVADDLHVAVAVRAEAHARLHPVLVDDAQRPEAHVLGVVVVGEGEAVEGVEPPVLGVAPFVGAADLCCHVRSCAFVLNIQTHDGVEKYQIKALNFDQPVRNN